jgi:DNA-binding response OmpR family regulator
MMSSSASKPRRILTYGYDEVLLDTRQAVLEMAGYEADIARSADEFHHRVSKADTPYDLFILCHTVPPVEQSSIRQAATDAGVAVYGMSSSISPEDFLLQVRAVLAIRW